jgi:phage terminase large subunit-like protein
MKTEAQQYPERVNRIIRFCEMLTVPDGMLAGQRVVLQPEQKRFINAVYGPRTAEGVRIVSQALLTMGRKNAKTALIAMLVLVHLCGPEAIRNGEIYSVAFDREQAAQVFKYASAMVYASEFLSRRLNVVETRKQISDSGSGSRYMGLSAESRTKHGKSSSVVIFDELAQFGQDRRLYDVMTTSTSAHNAPLLFYISTQAENDAALFSELVDYGKKVNTGEIKDPSFVAFIYEVPPDADPWDEKNWYLANPFLNIFKNLKVMREDAHKARTMPGAESAFRNLHLNQRVAAEAAFIPPDVWKRNGVAPDESLFESGCPCFGGLDLSAKNDLTAAVFVCMDDDRLWHARAFFWTPKDGIKERSQRDRVPYDLWAKQGFITDVPGPVIDYEYVARFLGDCHARFNIQAVRFDRWRIDYLKQELIKAGIPCWIEGKDDPVPGGLRLIPHGQGFKDFAPAVDRLEDLLLEGRIRHGNHPVLTMCAANTRVVKDPAGNRKFDKMKSTGRIDGLVALAMATNWTQDVEDDGQGSLEELYASDPIVVNW